MISRSEELSSVEACDKEKLVIDEKQNRLTIVNSVIKLSVMDHLISA